MSPNLVRLESDFLKHVTSMVTTASLDLSLNSYLQRFALKPEARNFLKVLPRNTFKKFLAVKKRKRERRSEAPPFSFSVLR